LKIAWWIDYSNPHLSPWLESAIVQPCCQEMTDEINQHKALGFGAYEFSASDSNRSINIYCGNWDWVSETPIRYCPFCGTLIEVEERPTVGRPYDSKYAG
jgi:hypothetical protein